MLRRPAGGPESGESPFPIYEQMLVSVDFVEGCDSFCGETGAGIQRVLTDWPEVEGSRFACDGATASSDPGCGREAAARLGRETSGTE